MLLLVPYNGACIYCTPLLLTKMEQKKWVAQTQAEWVIFSLQISASTGLWKEMKDTAFPLPSLLQLICTLHISTSSHFTHELYHNSYIYRETERKSPHGVYIWWTRGAETGLHSHDFPPLHCKYLSLTEINPGYLGSTPKRNVDVFNGSDPSWTDVLLLAPPFINCVWTTKSRCVLFC
jgi:hypothetical protein